MVNSGKHVVQVMAVQVGLTVLMELALLVLAVPTLVGGVSCLSRSSLGMLPHQPPSLPPSLSLWLTAHTKAQAA